MNNEINNINNKEYSNYDTNPNFISEDINDNPVNYVYDAPQAEREIPWKQLSIGGAFGLLVGGGSIVAANTMSSSDEEALLAGAEAGGNVKVEGAEENTPVGGSTTEPSVANESHAAAAASTASSPTSPSSSATPSSHANDVDVVETASPVHTVEEHHTHHVAPEHIDVFHEVNFIDMDDSLSFGEAFAQARAELGPGAAFEWRGGVFGTYHQSEWNSMTPSEQSEFTSIALRTSIHSVHDHYVAKASTVHHHFYEGDVVDLDTGLAYHDEPFHYEPKEYDMTSEGGDTANYHIHDNDIIVEDNYDYPSAEAAAYNGITVEGDTYMGGESVEIINDIVNEARTGVEQLVDFNNSVGNMLSDVNDMLDHVESSSGEIASIVDSGQEVINDIQELFDPSTESYETSTDPIPDYMPDADIDII